MYHAVVYLVASGEMADDVSRMFDDLEREGMPVSRSLKRIVFDWRGRTAFLKGTR